MDPEWRVEVASGEQDLVSSRGYRLDGPPGQVLFRKLCASCHTIKAGDRVGPDLYGVTLRRPRDWLQRFMMKPEEVRLANDPIALALMHRFPNVRMPDLGLTSLDADDLISYLESRTAMLDQQGADLAAGRTHE